MSRPKYECDNCHEMIASSNFSRHRNTCELRDSYCEFCGEYFRQKQYKSVSPMQKTCSLSCRTSLRNKEEGLHLKGGKAAGEYWISQRGTGLNPKTYVKENGRHQHRVVMERMLGRPLVKGEIVHHKDGNPKNNSEDNLELLTQSEHIKHHHPEMMTARKEKHGY